MDSLRRLIVTAATALPGVVWLNGWADNHVMAPVEDLILSSYEGGKPSVLAGGGWRGFSDPVHGRHLQC